MQIKQIMSDTKQTQIVYLFNDKILTEEVLGWALVSEYGNNQSILPLRNLGNRIGYEDPISTCGFVGYKSGNTSLEEFKYKNKLAIDAIKRSENG